MRPTVGLYALFLAAGCLTGLPAATAQNQPSPASPPAATPPATGTPAAAIPDQKLDAAAAAVKNVTAVKQDYQQKLAAAPEPDKARVVNEGNAALAKAVTDQGLSIEEYTRILQVAQNDPAVKEKIIQRLK